MKYMSQLENICGVVIFSLPMLLVGSERWEGEQHKLEKILDSLQEIINISFEQRTFENTFGSWSYLIGQSAELFAEIDSKHAARHFFNSVFQNVASHESLNNYAYRYLRDDGLSLYQRHTIHRFLGKTSPYLHLDGGESKIYMEGGFSVLNINVNEVVDSFFDDLVESIQSVGPDVLCVRGIYNAEEAFALYDFLKNDYMHFYLDIDPCFFDVLAVSSGMLIASKYNIENAEVASLPNGGLFDFVIKDAARTVGHVYAVYDRFMRSHEDCLDPVIKKMVDDFISIKSDDVAFCLCGELGSFFLLHSLSEHDLKINYKPEVKTFPVYIHDKHVGGLSVIGNHGIQGSCGLTSHSLARKRTIKPCNLFSQSNKDALILCDGNKIEGSISSDSRGNSSCEVHGSHTERRENGSSWSVEGRAELHRDHEGNVTATATGTFVVEF